jgi:hypothetical protein
MASRIPFLPGLGTIHYPVVRNTFTISECVLIGYTSKITLASHSSLALPTDI